MVVNLRLELNDQQLQQIKSCLEGKPRKVKATRKEVQVLVDLLLAEAMSNESPPPQ